MGMSINDVQVVQNKTGFSLEQLKQMGKQALLNIFDGNKSGTVSDKEITTKGIEGGDFLEIREHLNSVGIEREVEKPKLTSKSNQTSQNPIKQKKDSYVETFIANYEANVKAEIKNVIRKKQLLPATNLGPAYVKDKQGNYYCWNGSSFSKENIKDITHMFRSMKKQNLQATLSSNYAKDKQGNYYYWNGSSFKKDNGVIFAEGYKITTKSGNAISVSSEDNTSHYSYLLLSKDGKQANKNPDEVAKTFCLGKVGEFYYRETGRGRFYYTWKPETCELVYSHSE